jgi:hypothetical protein
MQCQLPEEPVKIPPPKGIALLASPEDAPGSASRASLASAEEDVEPCESGAAKDMAKESKVGAKARANVERNVKRKCRIGFYKAICYFQD